MGENMNTISAAYLGIGGILGVGMIFTGIVGVAFLFEFLVRRNEK